MTLPKYKGDTFAEGLCTRHGYILYVSPIKDAFDTDNMSTIFITKDEEIIGEIKNYDHKIFTIVEQGIRKRFISLIAALNYFIANQQETDSV